MLSIEEIKLLIEKLERVKKEDFQKLIDDNLQILKDIEKAVDANNIEKIDYIHKTPDWFRLDLEQKRNNPYKWQKVDEPLRKLIKTKIFQFSKSNAFNSLEIGPGDGMFSMDFRAWKNNYFLDILGDREPLIRKKFPKPHQKYLRFVLEKDDYCAQIPRNSCNFVFSWDTFVFFNEEKIRKYLKSIKDVLIPGGYCFINYADCHFDEDLKNASRGYWAYNTKTKMTNMLEENNFKIVEMNMYKPGASYAIFKRPGNQNPFIHKVSELELD